MSCSHAYECSNNSVGLDPTIEANPDIAGLGVVLSFVITAIFTSCAVWFHWVLVEQLARLAKDPDPWAQRRWAYLRPKTCFLRNGRLKESFRKLAAMLSDQQIITGSCIIIAAYAKRCSITQYHFRLVVDMSWLAFTTVEATIQIAGEPYRAGPLLRLWRAAWIISFSAMILVSEYALKFYGVNKVLIMQCLWDWPHERLAVSAFPSLSVSIVVWESVKGVLILWGLVSILQSLFQFEWQWLRGAGSFLDRIARLPLRLDLYLDTFLSPHRRLWKEFDSKPGTTPPRDTSRSKVCLFTFLRPLTFTVATFMLLLHVLVRSSTPNRTRIISLVFFYTCNIFLRRINAKAMMKGDEDEWGFGQILPLLILMLPLTSVFQFFHESTDDAREPEDGDEDEDSEVPLVETSQAAVARPSSTQGLNLSQSPAITPSVDAPMESDDPAVPLEDLSGIRRRATTAMEAGQPHGTEANSSSDQPSPKILMDMNISELDIVLHKTRVFKMAPHITGYILLLFISSIWIKFQLVI